MEKTESSDLLLSTNLKLPVAPVRVRGLKYAPRDTQKSPPGRTREGAWIEIRKIKKLPAKGSCGTLRMISIQAKTNMAS